MNKDVRTHPPTHTHSLPGKKTKKTKKKSSLFGLK